MKVKQGIASVDIKEGSQYSIFESILDLPHQGFGGVAFKVSRTLPFAINLDLYISNKD